MISCVRGCSSAPRIPRQVSLLVVQCFCRTRTTLLCYRWLNENGCLGSSLKDVPSGNGDIVQITGSEVDFSQKIVYCSAKMSVLNSASFFPWAHREAWGKWSSHFTLNFTDLRKLMKTDITQFYRGHVKLDAACSLRPTITFQTFALPDVKMLAINSTPTQIVNRQRMKQVIPGTFQLMQICDCFSDD